MLFTATGLVKDHFHILGLSTYPVHLLDGPTPILFEGGVACAGEMYAEAIRSILGTRQPRILFLTHVHWDHCGAVSYLKEIFPSLRIAASREAANTLRKQSAIEFIEKFNKSAKPIVAVLPGIDPSRLVDEIFRPFEIDIELKNGQVIELGEGLSVEVLATSGHTRDLLSYYIPQKRLLIASEASGCLDSVGNVIPQFIVDYDAYLSSVNRLASLDVEILCQGHRFVFVGRDEVRAFFTRSAAETIHFKNRVYELLETEDGSVDRVVSIIKAEQYDLNKGIKQPETAYLLNLRGQVTHLAGKRSGGKASSIVF